MTSHFIYHLFPEQCYLYNNKGNMYESFVEVEHTFYIRNKHLAVIFSPSQMARSCLLNGIQSANIPTPLGD